MSIHPKKQQTQHTDTLFFINGLFDRDRYNKHRLSQVSVTVFIATPVPRRAFYSLYYTRCTCLSLYGGIGLVSCSSKAPRGVSVLKKWDQGRPNCTYNTTMSCKTFRFCSVNISSLFRYFIMSRIYWTYVTGACLSLSKPNLT